MEAQKTKVIWFMNLKSIWSWEKFFGKTARISSRPTVASLWARASWGDSLRKQQRHWFLIIKEEEKKCYFFYGSKIIWLSIIFWFWHLFLASSHFDHFGIFGIFDILALWYSKENSIKRKDAKIKATMIFNDVFFDLKMPKCQKCQSCQNGQNAKMQKKCRNAKRPKNASPL